MSSQFIELNAPSMQGLSPKTSENLPHGLLALPDRVREIVAHEEERLSREYGITPSPEARRRLMDDLTLQYYFDGLGHEVLYRSTPAGPEVLAVGFEEILTRRQGKSLEEQLAFHTWLP